MPKKQSSRRSPRIQRPRGKKLVAALALALVCVAGTSMLAQVNSRKKSRKASDDFGVMAFPASGPSKEYIYAGSKLIATVEPTAVNGNDAQFVSMCAYDSGNAPGSVENCFSDMKGCGIFGSAGTRYRIEVKMLNTGTTTWSPPPTGQTTGGYWLRSQNPGNNTTWGLNGQPLPASVGPGQYVTFAFHASKPFGSAPGGYFNFQWQMYQDNGVGFFGEKTKNFSFSDLGWACQQVFSESASFVSQTVSSTMVAGQIYSVSVKMHNAGTSTWTTAGNYKLGSQFPDNNTTWGLSRKSLPTSIAPNTDATFTFNVTAPTIPGTYYFQWMMVQDGGTGWFGSASPLLNISVNPPPPAPPSNLFAFTPPPGSTQITMTWSDNSGNEDGFKIEQLNGNSGWVQIATVGPGVAAYTATGLSLDQQYCYRVRAYNVSGGNSAYSNQDCRWTSSGGD